jgi:hypothetical protein
MRMYRVNGSMAQRNIEGINPLHAVVTDMAPHPIASDTRIAATPLPLLIPSDESGLLTMEIATVSKACYIPAFIAIDEEARRHCRSAHFLKRSCVKQAFTSISRSV